MICENCGAEMSTEDKVIAAIFGNTHCAYCQRKEECIKYPDILVNGRPLSNYLVDVQQWSEYEDDYLSPSSLKE